MNQIHTIRVGDQDYILHDPNAVTPAQLDEKTKQLLALLCPEIRKEGSVVCCQPVSGYPLQVITRLPESEGSIQLTLYRCGKNLFDRTAYSFKNSMINYSSGAESNSSGYSATDSYMPVAHLRGQTITLNHPGVEKSQTTNAGLVFYDANKDYISGSNSYTHLVPETAVYLRFSVPREYADGTQVQLELGETVTPWEPYRGQKYTAEVSGKDHAWADVTPWSGINVFWSSTGSTAVEGRADPVAILNQLITK